MPSRCHAVCQTVDEGAPTYVGFHPRQEVVDTSAQKLCCGAVLRRVDGEATDLVRILTN